MTVTVPGRLVVIVPSRGRPQNVARLVQAWADTQATAVLWVAVDIDDPHLPEYRRLAPPAILMVGTPAGMPGALNQSAGMAADSGFDHIGFMGDDHLPRTAGWDRRVVDTLDRYPTGVCYGDDLMHGPALPTAVFMTAAIPATLGYMCPPGFTHLYLDNVWKAWGEGIGRLTYLPDVVIEHLHPQAGGKADWDDGYTRVNAGPVWEADTAAWNLYRAGRLHHDLAALATVGEHP